MSDERKLDSVERLTKMITSGGLARTLDERAELALAEMWDLSRREALLEAAELAQKWIDAYPPDIWTEVTYAEGVAAIDKGVIVDRWAAAQGRHIGKRMIEDLGRLAVEEGTK